MASKESGCVYGQTTRIQEKIKKKDMLAYDGSMGDSMTKEEEKNYFYGMEQADDGSYYDDTSCMEWMHSRFRK